jgi:hypothetical protein
MPMLGDIFPENEKREFIKRKLVPGCVIYLFCDFISPKKDKFLVVGNLNEKPLLFFINSKISHFVTTRPYLLQSQVLLKATDYSKFLDHDSYLNCGEVINYFDENVIIDQLINDTRRFRGELNKQTKSEIIKVIATAKTISHHNKMLIITSLTD